MTTPAKPVILVNELERVVTTIFADGTELHAAPNHDKESWARAHALGYPWQSMGALPMDPNAAWLADTMWQMTKDHERLHHLVADALGREHSTALWHAAHPEQTMTPTAQAQADAEERIVLLIQRLLNQGLE